MIKAPITLQDLRRKIYVKAKAEPSWRFWGLYVHVCKLETLLEAYKLSKKNNGAPGIDGVSFLVIESNGVEGFLEEIREELVNKTYMPRRVRKVGIPKAGGKERMLSIPTIRDRVVQGALKIILEPIFEADFQPGSFGYRPKKSPHEAVKRVSRAIIEGKTQVIDLDLRSYFDNVRHHIVLKKVAQRINDDDVMYLLKMIMKSSGKRGVPQGGVISPLISNIYLNEVDKMLEKAKEVTKYKQWTAVEYARFADDLVVLVDAHPRQRWLKRALVKRLGQEFAKLGLEVNEEKSRIANLEQKEAFGFLGFQFHRKKSRSGKWMPLVIPEPKKRTALLRRLKTEFRSHRSQPVQRLVARINTILRGWVNYFAIGNSSVCFSFVRQWVERKIRRHLARARQGRGFGWKGWSRDCLYQKLGLYCDYRVKYVRS
ncbi:MAG: group II intron reverse transcriptase/maturase [Proteobacteria bacterium]|nr:group II intron reverse transcriptase/maturase [Pseudomonadota bacterium]